MKWPRKMTLGVSPDFVHRIHFLMPLIPKGLKILRVWVLECRNTKLSKETLRLMGSDQVANSARGFTT